MQHPSVNYTMRKSAEECTELASELLKSANKGDYSKRRLKRIKSEYQDVLKTFIYLKAVLKKAELIDLD